jgi:hypothetical protein
MFWIFIWSLCFRGIIWVSLGLRLGNRGVGSRSKMYYLALDGEWRGGEITTNYYAISPHQAAMIKKNRACHRMTSEATKSKPTFPTTLKHRNPPISSGLAYKNNTKPIIISKTALIKRNMRR